MSTGAQHILEKRDYFNDTQRPGYKPYPYPHPLGRKWPRKTPEDRSAPTVPQNLAACAVSERRTELTWEPSSDNKAVRGYYVWLSGKRVTTITDPGCTAYTFRRLKSSPAQHAFAVSAFDAAGNESGASAPADKPLVVELWPGTVPDEAGAIGAEKVVMSPVLDRKQVEVTESTRMVTNVTRPTITIYRPAKSKDTGTAALICPGGGYWNLYWELEGEDVAAWLNSLGVTGIILKYRVPRRSGEPKGEPARRPLQDAQRAVSLVRSKAGEWGIGPRRIGIVGFSAGGHLALANGHWFPEADL